MTLHTYILKFYIMMKMIGLILVDPLNQKIHGKIEQKKDNKNQRLTLILPVVKYIQENPQKFATYP